MGEPSIPQRLAGVLGDVIRAAHAVAGSAHTRRHGARRRHVSLHAYGLSVASQLGWAATSRIATLRHRPAAERRLVTAFVLSLVLVASVFADARPAEPVGAAVGPGAGEYARAAGLEGYADIVRSDAQPVQETSNSVDPGLPSLAAQLDGEDPGASGWGAPYLPDGTLLKPVAVDASLPNLQRGDVTIYRVRAGDTLTGIASRFRVSMMTIWWANKLTATDSLKVGQQLAIPPVSGILWTVKEGDSLSSIASATKANVSAIRSFNDLTSDTLIIGQQLMIPGGRGAPAPTPKPTPKPKPVARSGGTSSGCSGCTFSGTLRWPVAGGYISQYFSYYHQAIDIAATYGTSVMASAYGKVIWAGYRQNCGGYQIWVDHGNGISTGYYHLSAILVGAGSYVGRGQQIGRIGTSGCTTGPHLHFEVWVGGPMYNGGYRVNPLLYL